MEVRDRTEVLADTLRNDRELFGIMEALGKGPHAVEALQGLLFGVAERDPRRMAETLWMAMAVVGRGQGRELRRVMIRMGVTPPDWLEPEVTTWAELSKALQAVWQEQQRRLAPAVYRAMQLLKRASQAEAVVKYHPMPEEHVELARALDAIDDAEAAAAATFRAMGMDAKTADRRARGAENSRVHRVATRGQQRAERKESSLGNGGKPRKPAGPQASEREERAARSVTNEQHRTHEPNGKTQRPNGAAGGTTARSRPKASR